MVFISRASLLCLSSVGQNPMLLTPKYFASSKITFTSSAVCPLAAPPIASVTAIVRMMRFRRFSPS